MNTGTIPSFIYGQIALIFQNMKVFTSFFCNFAAVITILMHIIMSERDKQIEKERKGVVELLLKKNGLTRRQLVDDLVGMWAASWVHILTEEEKRQFPHLVF